MNSYEEETQQETKAKAYLSFKTQKGEDITYTSLFNSLGSNHEYEAYNSEIRDKINRPTDKYHRLGNLKQGEWASVENQYTETGMFDFTVRNNGKIRSPEDIAFIFRSLESQSVEHAFAVYTNEKKQPFVQWLSMGGVSGTVIDSKLLADAAARFDAKDIYFVHNHPSGNLKASRADRNMLGRLKKAFSPQNINIHGIILNLNSGHYLTFQEKQNVEESHKPNFNPKEEQSPVPIYSFSKRAFLNSPLDTTRINSPKTVATFLSQQRFASGQKRGYLLLDKSNAIIGNFFPTEKDLTPSVKEAATLVSRYGASSLVAYGKDIMQDRKWFLDFQQHLKNFDINLLDVIEVKDSRYVKKTHDYYTSLADEGLLLEPNAMEDYTKPHKSQNQSQEGKLNLQTLKNEVLENNWFGKEEKTIAESLLHAIENNEEEKIRTYFKYGNSATKIIRNINEYNHSLKFGFSALKFDEYGWIEHNAQWTNKEKFSFGKPLPFGENAVEVGMGANEKWTFSNQYASGNGGGGGSISVFGESFDSKKEALNAGIDDLEQFHKKIVESPHSEKKETQISEKMLHILKDYRRKQNQLSLFDNPKTEIEKKAMDIPNEKSLDLRVGGRYQIDSHMGGVFEVEYIGKNQEGEHLFENKLPFDGFEGKRYHVKPENVESFIKVDLRKNSHTMEQKNLDYLTNQIKYLGFGEKQKENLQKQMETGEQKFNLVVKQQYDGFPVNYTLHFDKSKQSDMYFLNSYKATMENGREQAIYLNKGKGFTAKETFNMMQGRAVFKQLKNKEDGTMYHAWIKLSKAQKGKNIKDSRNLHIYNKNYGYNLNESLRQHPIKELENSGEKEKLIHSLQKGNRQAVTFKRAGREERKFIEANPQFKSLQVYDSNGKRAFVNPKKNVAVDSDNKNHSTHNQETNNAPKRQTASGFKR